MTEADAPRVVILNDTSTRSHHGCARVMRLLVEGLQRHGLQVIARSPARHHWASDAAFVVQLRRADLIVINGEGTLHHGRPAGQRLLEVTRHADARVPVAVVNALWQDNPADWAAMLGRCALVSARDGRSQAAMQAQGVAARLVPDLSLTAGASIGAGAGDRHGLIVGDSVRLSTRRALARAAARLRAEAILPTKTRHSALWNGLLARSLLSAVYNATLPFTTPPLVLARDEAAYLAALSGAAMHLTGRFHGVCLSIVTGTPFLAVSSNSWKVAALLEDAGLSQSRHLPPEALPDLNPAALNRPFTADERAGIAAFLARAASEADTLFADLAALARGRA